MCGLRILTLKKKKTQQSSMNELGRGAKKEAGRAGHCDQDP